MKNRLKKGMYLWEKGKKPSKLFGIVYGTVVPEGYVFVKNTGWYNKWGEELGRGDLAAFNIKRLKNELLDGEFFIVLSQEDSWERTINEAHKKYPKKFGRGKTPGSLYVASRAWIIIASKVVYEVKSFGISLRGTGVRRGIKIRIISREDACNLILKNKKPA
ncbi:MAG: hypothetical protein AB1333_03635 [Patescibacteria group bacterium]